MVLLRRQLYFSKDPEGNQHFPGGGGGPTFPGGGPNARETHITCDFPGGGGGSGPLSRMSIIGKKLVMRIENLSSWFQSKSQASLLSKLQILNIKDADRTVDV